MDVAEVFLCSGQLQLTVLFIRLQVRIIAPLKPVQTTDTKVLIISYTPSKADD